MTANQIILPLIAMTVATVVCGLIVKARHIKRKQPRQVHMPHSDSVAYDKTAIARSVTAGHLDGGAGGAGGGA